MYWNYSYQWIGWCYRTCKVFFPKLDFSLYKHFTVFGWLFCLDLMLYCVYPCIDQLVNSLIGLNWIIGFKLELVIIGRSNSMLFQVKIKGNYNLPTCDLPKNTLHTYSLKINILPTWGKFCLSPVTHIY